MISLISYNLFLYDIINMPPKRTTSPIGQIAHQLNNKYSAEFINKFISIIFNKAFGNIFFGSGQINRGGKIVRNADVTKGVFALIDHLLGKLISNDDFLTEAIENSNIDGRFEFIEKFNKELTKIYKSSHASGMSQTDIPLSKISADKILNKVSKYLSNAVKQMNIDNLSQEEIEQKMDLLSIDFNRRLKSTLTEITKMLRKGVSEDRIIKYYEALPSFESIAELRHSSTNALFEIYRVTDESLKTRLIEAVNEFNMNHKRKYNTIDLLNELLSNNVHSDLSSLSNNQLVELIDAYKKINIPDAIDVDTPASVSDNDIVELEQAIENAATGSERARQLNKLKDFMFAVWLNSGKITKSATALAALYKIMPEHIQKYLDKLKNYSGWSKDQKDTYNRAVELAKMFEHDKTDETIKQFESHIDVLKQSIETQTDDAKTQEESAQPEIDQIKQDADVAEEIVRQTSVDENGNLTKAGEDKIVAINQSEQDKLNQIQQAIADKAKDELKLEQQFESAPQEPMPGDTGVDELVAETNQAYQDALNEIRNRQNELSQQGSTALFSVKPTANIQIGLPTGPAFKPDLTEHERMNTEHYGGIGRRILGHDPRFNFWNTIV